MTELKALAAEKSRIKMEEKLKEKENESTEVKKINCFVTFFTSLETRRAIYLALKTSLLPTLSVHPSSSHSLFISSLPGPAGLCDLVLSMFRMPPAATRAWAGPPGVWPRMLKTFLTWTRFGDFLGKILVEGHSLRIGCIFCVFDIH